MIDGSDSSEADCSDSPSFGTKLEAILSIFLTIDSGETSFSGETDSIVACGCLAWSRVFLKCSKFLNRKINFQNTKKYSVKISKKNIFLKSSLIFIYFRYVFEYINENSIDE